MNLTRAPMALLVLTTVVMIGCGATVGAEEPPPSAPPGGLVVVANGMAFDRAELTVPADIEFALLFENRESAPHNVAILDPESGQSFFAGEVFGGAASRIYTVPAIRAGVYAFRCDVHPNMAGTLTAVAPSPAPAPG
jgi:plastocyanin